MSVDEMTHHKHRRRRTQPGLMDGRNTILLRHLYSLGHQQSHLMCLPLDARFLAHLDTVPPLSSPSERLNPSVMQKKVGT